MFRQQHNVTRCLCNMTACHFSFTFPPMLSGAVQDKCSHLDAYADVHNYLEMQSVCMCVWGWDKRLHRQYICLEHKHCLIQSKIYFENLLGFVIFLYIISHSEGRNTTSANNENTEPSNKKAWKIKQYALKGAVLSFCWRNIFRRLTSC